MRSKSKPIYVNEKVVGNVTCLAYYKTVTGSKHFLRTPPAISNDVQALRDAEKAGAIAVIIRDKETGIRYKSSIEAIFKFGISLNRGYGNQIALPMKYWIITPNKRSKP